MVKPQIKIPNRPKPYLIEAYNGYYGNLNEFFTITVRFWESRSPMYNDASLLCTVFTEHIIPTSKNGYMNEFHIRSLEECYAHFEIWVAMEFYTRNWKYCEYYIGSEPVYHNELDCYIRNLLKNVTFPDIKVFNPETELKKRRGKWVNEKLLYNIVESIFANCTVLYHYRPKWLEGLELDIYIEDFKIGIEYQGIQHYQIVEHWGGEAGLKKRQFNDAKKMRLCAEHGAKLLYFDHTEPITNVYVKNKILKFLQKEEIYASI
jgi:hypothetical protein